MDYSILKAGDHVWVGVNRKSTDIRTILKVTPTQIVLQPGREFDRYDKKTGWQRSRMMFRQCIASLASHADWEKWEAERLKAEEARRIAAQADAEREARGKELSALFPEGLVFNLHPYKRESKLGTYQVELFHLTEDQVRQLAGLLHAIPGAA